MHAVVQVADNRRLADPPLMRLESEGGHAYLSMLLQLSASQAGVQQQADVEARLVTLSLATLQRFQVCFCLNTCAALLLLTSRSTVQDGGICGAW